MAIWPMFSERDKVKSAKNISIFVNQIFLDCKKRGQVFTKIAAMRTNAIRQYSINVDNHPILIQLNIISDYFFCFWSDLQNYSDAEKMMEDVQELLNTEDYANIMYELSQIKGLSA